MKVFVFDLDGVVFEKSNFSNRLRLDFGISTEMTVSFFRGPFEKCQLGQADLKAELPRFLAEWGWTSRLQAFLDFWFDCDSVVRPRVLEQVAMLRKTGNVCCLATNQEKYRAQFLCRHLHIDEHFDSVFSSHLLGHRKPADSFFEAIEKTLAVNPKHICFWDDGIENVQSSRMRGWNAEMFTDIAALRQSITRNLA